MIWSLTGSRHYHGVSRRSRMLWLGLAYTGVGMGAIGAVLPVMPTTPFLLLALWAGARSSPQLRYRLYRHPRFGATLRAWHRHGVVPPPAKWTACSLMLVSAATLWFTAAPPRLFAAVISLFLLVAAFILTRPSRFPEKDSTAP